MWALVFNPPKTKKPKILVEKKTFSTPVTFGAQRPP